MYSNASYQIAENIYIPIPMHTVYVYSYSFNFKKYHGEGVFKPGIGPILLIYFKLRFSS